MSNTTKSFHLLRTALLALTIHVLTVASSEAGVNASFTFSPSNPKAGQQVQFMDTSTGNPTHWLWDFVPPSNVGDSTAQNPTWTFNTPGTYAVKLIALIPPLDIDDVVINVVVGEACDPLSVSITVDRGGGVPGRVQIRPADRGRRGGPL